MPAFAGPPMVDERTPPALGAGTLPMLNDAGIPSRTIDSELVIPTVSVYVPVAVSSALLPPSYVVIAKVSLPGGDGGPKTVQPLPQVVLFSGVVAGLFASAPTGLPLTSFSKIEIDCIDDEMDFGERLFDALPLTGMVRWNVGCTNPVGTLVGTALGTDPAGTLVEPPPPPPQAARTSRLASAMGVRKEITSVGGR